MRFIFNLTICLLCSIGAISQGNFGDAVWGIGETNFVPTQQFEVRADDGGAVRERIARFTLDSGDTSSGYDVYKHDMFEIRNSTGALNTMAPTIHGHRETTNGTSFTIIGSTHADQDTGDKAITNFISRTYTDFLYQITTGPAGEDEVENRPLFRWSNNYTTLMQMEASGNLGIGTTGAVNVLDVEGGVAIGSGYAGTNTAPTNGLIVEGNVGIGTNSPGTNTRFHAVSDEIIDQGDDHFFFETTSGSGNNDGTVFRIYSRRGSGFTNGDIFRVENQSLTGSSAAFRIRGDGKTGVGLINSGYIFTVNGSALAFGGSWTPSDKRLKENIRVITDPVEKLKELRGVRYEYRETEKLPVEMHGQPSVGIIAQEVEQVFPELVRESDGIMAVNYDGLIGLLIESQKEQQESLEELLSEISEMENELANDMEADSKAGKLYQNNPNPFSFESEIQYEIVRDYSNAFIGFYDLNGMEIMTVPLHSARGEIKINSSDLGRGQFLYSLVLDGRIIETKRLMIGY